MSEDMGLVTPLAAPSVVSRELANEPATPSDGAQRTIAVTYLIYIVLFEAMIFGGAAYWVFARGRRGWWMLVALLISSCAYSPAKWHGLMTGTDGAKPDKSA